MTASEGPYILTIDIGTSSTRALLFDRQARPLDAIFAKEPTEMTTGPDGTAIFDPEALLDAMARCIDTALAKAGPLAGQIGAVAIDTFVSNFIALDAAGQPLTPLITYADTRNTADATLLRQRLDERDAHERTGCLLRSSYWPARIAWLQRTQPDVWRRTRALATLGELIERRLFGRSRVSSSAASWGGLLNRRTLGWDAELLGALEVPRELLGEVVDASAPLLGLAAPFRSRWPALAQVPWLPAIGDGAAANLGSGCVDSRTMALTVGTTGAMRVVREHVDAVPAGLWCYRVDARRTLLGGATSEGGNVFAWLQRTTQLPGPGDAALASVAPDSHGLTILPFFAGERSPGWAGDARATITGMTMATTPLEIGRAALEAVAYRFALIARAMRGASAATPTILASGGSLLRSDVWMQICADAIGLPITASGEGEATSRGAALLALAAIGAIADMADLPAAQGATYAPNPQTHAIYQAAIERQQALYRQLIGG